MLIMAVVYWRYTQDCPAGNFSDLRAAGIPFQGGGKGGWASFKAACRNHRAWLLFVTYGACFGIEIFIHNIAAIYYVDHYGLSLKAGRPGRRQLRPAGAVRPRPRRLAVGPLRSAR